jgi:hypothetical protein
MRPTFADPTVDFAFYRLFGTAGHKGLLIALLNALLDLDADHRIIEVERLSREQRPPVTRLETMRIVRFTERERDAYTRALIALQDARGAIALARRQGFEEGLAEVRLDNRPRKP